jgi:hypothetical protein
MRLSNGFAPTAKSVRRAASLRSSNLPFDIIDKGIGKFYGTFWSIRSSVEFQDYYLARVGKPLGPCLSYI